MALTANGQTWGQLEAEARAAGLYADCWLDTFSAEGFFIVGDKSFRWHGYGLEYVAALLAAQAHVRELAGARKGQPAGVSDAPRIPCARSAWHGFHPDTETCPWC